MRREIEKHLSLQDNDERPKYQKQQSILRGLCLHLWQISFSLCKFSKFIKVIFKDFFPRICLRDFEQCMKDRKGLAAHMNVLLKELPLKINVNYDFVVQAQVSHDDPNNVIYRIIDSFMIIWFHINYFFRLIVVKTKFLINIFTLF